MSAAGLPYQNNTLPHNPQAGIFLSSNTGLSRKTGKTVVYAGIHLPVFRLNAGIIPKQPTPPQSRTYGSAGYVPFAYNKDTGAAIAPPDRIDCGSNSPEPELLRAGEAL
jgi:hypothetical protein